MKVSFDLIWVVFSPAHKWRIGHLAEQIDWQSQLKDRDWLASLLTHCKALRTRSSDHGLCDARRKDLIVDLDLQSRRSYK
jgi:hypothetical protein